MEKPQRNILNISKILKIILIIFILIFLIIFIYLKIIGYNIGILKSKTKSIDTNKEPSKTTIIETNFESVDKFGIKLLYPTISNGRTWYANWSNNISRTLRSIQRDPSDQGFVARGNGSISINGMGIATLEGESPRMYILDPSGEKKWNNVEVTVYTKRVSESGVTSSQGIVIGARSEHQDATMENPCLGATYYGRLLYDGRAVFQKEIIHEGAYSINKPKENNKAVWNTKDGTMPFNVWVGVKFIVKNNPDGKSVKLELYRDLTDGENGGTWEKVAEYTDSGDWSQTDSGADIMKKCGYLANKVLLDAGKSVFIRNDMVKDVEYKLWSIREIQ